MLIDGGAGQLAAARQVLQDLGIADVAVAAIAKGPERNAGRERIFLPDRPPLQPAPRDPVLYLPAAAARRGAPLRHRQPPGAALGEARHSRRSTRSPASAPRRKKALLHHFGSSRAVERAGLADLEVVPGISRSIATKDL